jgi:hypothetical protein
MRNKTTKKYKHNKRKTRKIRGGGYFESLFQTTTDTNKEIEEIKQLETTLAKNMQDLTNTYNSVYKKVTNLNNKINNLSNISNTNQQNETQNEEKNGIFDNIGNMLGYQKNNSQGQQNETQEQQSQYGTNRRSIESEERSNVSPQIMSFESNQNSVPNSQGPQQEESPGFQEPVSRSMSNFEPANESGEPLDDLEDNQPAYESGEQSNESLSGGKRKSRRKHRARNR